MTSTAPLLTGVKRRIWIVVLFGIAGALLGAAPQPQKVEEQATTFEATHTMLLNDANGLSSSVGVSPNQVVILSTVGEVPKRVAEEIGFEGNPAELSSQVSVSFDQSSGALLFTTSQDTAERAELVADAFADVTNAYLIERQESVYNERVQRSRERLEEFEGELNELTRQLALDPENPVLLGQRDAISREYSAAFEQDRSLSPAPSFLTFTTLQRAQAVPVVDRGLSAPTGRSTRAIMGLIVGLAVGVAIALLLARTDRKIRSREQAEDILGMRARVEIPMVKTPDSKAGVVVVHGRHDMLSDSYRTLRNVVTFIQSGAAELDRAHVTVVVSPGQGDGKTALAANLAAAWVETGRRTIAMNTDFRRPRLTQAINGEPPAGLPFDLEELELIDPTLLLRQTRHSKLLMMDLSPIAAPPSELVRSTADHLPTVSGIADEIVIDTSPVGTDR